jgi:hypothetical protein
MPLSQHAPDGTLGGSEVSAVDAYRWTEGRAMFADVATSGTVELPDGQVRQLRPLNTAYVFPGRDPVEAGGKVEGRVACAAERARSVACDWLYACVRCGAARSVVPMRA